MSRPNRKDLDVQTLNGYLSTLFRHKGLVWEETVEAALDRAQDQVPLFETGPVNLTEVLPLMKPLPLLPGLVLGKERKVLWKVLDQYPNHRLLVKDWGLLGRDGLFLVETYTSNRHEDAYRRARELSRWEIGTGPKSVILGRSRDQTLVLAFQLAQMYDPGGSNLC